MNTNKSNFTEADVLADALEHCFISPNAYDANGEAANLVDVVDRAARNLSRIAHAITPEGAVAFDTPGGGQVRSLTEAVIFMAQNIGRVADAISDVAKAMEDGRA